MGEQGKAGAEQGACDGPLGAWCHGLAPLALALALALELELGLEIEIEIELELPFA